MNEPFYIYSNYYIVEIQCGFGHYCPVFTESERKICHLLSDDTQCYYCHIEIVFCSWYKRYDIR